MAASLRAALFSVSYATLGIVATTETWAQTTTAQQGQGASELPPVRITAPEPRRRANTAPAERADRAGPHRRSQVARRPEAQVAPKPFAESQDARTGTVGVYANSTSIATKTNAPLVNIPQSITVVTKDFIRDQGFQSLTEVTRYVPASRSIRARAIGTNSSSAASIPAPISSSMDFATTSSISAISTTPRASKS
jgi:catecholate siderophore receptor